MKKIVTIGGGTGTAVINEALLRTGKVDHIDSIVTTFDSGGETGRRRLDSYGKEIAYSDAIRILISLIDPAQAEDKNVQVIKRWLLHRDKRDKVLGREIVHTFFDQKNGISQIENDLADLGIKLRGNVRLASTHSSYIVFTTKSGLKFKGENLLDENRTSRDMIDKISLMPKVPAYIPTLKAIEDADVIFLSCGSFYGSLLCNFLPAGIKTAMQNTKAKVYLVTNLLSTRNETHKFTPKDFADTVELYAGRRIDGIIIPNMTKREFEEKYPEAAYLYKIRESSYFLGWEKDELDKIENEGIKIIKHNAVNVIDLPEQNKIIVRHDPSGLSDTFKKLV